MELLQAAGLKAVPDRHRARHGDGGRRARLSRSPPCAATSRPTAAAPGSPSPTTGRPTRRGATSPSTRMSCSPDGRLLRSGRRPRRSQGAPRALRRRCRSADPRGCAAAAALLPLLRPFRRAAAGCAALAAVRRLAPLLPTLSGERIAAETLKLLAAPDPAAVLRLMQRPWRAGASPAGGRAISTAWRGWSRSRRRWALPPEPPRRLAALLEGEAAARWRGRTLALSNALRDRVWRR